MLPGGLLNTPSWCMVVTSKYGHSSTVSLEVQGWRPIVLKATGCVQVLSFDVLGLLELRESVRDRAGPINGGLFLGSAAVCGSPLAGNTAADCRQISGVPTQSFCSPNMARQFSIAWIWTEGACGRASLWTPQWVWRSIVKSSVALPSKFRRRTRLTG